MSRRVIDADRHVSEPLGMWLEYLEPEFRPYAPRMRMADTPLPELTVDGLPLFANWGLEFQREASQQGRQHARELHKATSGAGQLESMDAAGISEAYLFPTLATFLVNHEKLAAPVSAGFARAYNRWLLDYCAKDPTRLHPVGMVSRHDPAMALAESSGSSATAIAVC